MGNNKTEQTPLEALPEGWQRYIKRLRHKAELDRQTIRQLTETVKDLTRKLGGNPAAK